MIRTLTCLAVLGLSLVLIGEASLAQEKKDKEVTLKGNITCGKCELSVDKACATVIVVTGKDKKDVVYYFDAKGHKEHHGAICSEGKKGEVTGTVSKDGKKNVVTVKSLKFN